MQVNKWLIVTGCKTKFNGFVKKEFVINHFFVFNCARTGLDTSINLFSWCGLFYLLKQGVQPLTNIAKSSLLSRCVYIPPPCATKIIYLLKNKFYFIKKINLYLQKENKI